MAIQLSAAVRQSMIATYIATVSTTPKLNFYSGTKPTATTSAATGTTLATLTLPSTWVTSAAGVTTIASGPWTGTGISAGTIGYFRLNDSANTTVIEQGDVAVGSGDINLDNNVIAVGQTISISTWTRTQGGA